MIFHPVTTITFWFNDFPQSKYGMEKSDTKFPVQILLGTIVDYKKVWCLHPGEYFQVHQEGETHNTTDNDWTFKEIILGIQ